MPLDISIRSTMPAATSPANPAQRRQVETSETTESAASSAAQGIQDTVSFSSAAKSAQKTSTPGATRQLSDDEKAQVEKLKQIDQRVHQHEQAHLSASGGNARGGASYTYTTGPDGKQYATGGEVSIDVSPASTPQATIQKMAAVKGAAVAPADPSGQDRAVYAQAQRIEQEARQELAKQAGAATESAGNQGRTQSAATGLTNAVVAAYSGSQPSDQTTAPRFDATA